MNGDRAASTLTRRAFWALLALALAAAVAVVAWVAWPGDANDDTNKDTVAEILVPASRVPPPGGDPVFLPEFDGWLVHLPPAGDGIGTPGPGLVAFDARVPQSGALALWMPVEWVAPEVCSGDPCVPFGAADAPGFFFDVNSRFSAAGTRVFGPEPHDLPRHRVRLGADGGVAVSVAKARESLDAPLVYDGPTATPGPRRLVLLADRASQPYPLPDLLAAGFLVRFNPTRLFGVEATGLSVVVADTPVFDRPAVRQLLADVAAEGGVVAAIDVAMVDLLQVTSGVTSLKPWGPPGRSPHIALAVRGTCTRQTYLTMATVDALSRHVERGTECASTAG